MRSHDNIAVKEKQHKPTRNKVNNTKNFYEITTIEEDDESSTQNQLQAHHVPHSRGMSHNKQNNRYKNMNSDLDRVVRNTERTQVSLTDSEVRKNVSPKRQEEPPLEQTYYQQYKNRNSNMDTTAGKEHQENIKSKIKPVLPNLGNRLDGITTK